MTAIISSMTVSKRTDTLTKETFTSRFFFATFAKVWISLVSLTKALMTRIPVKFSWVKS